MDPTWSADGKRIAFVSFRTGAPQIFAINADGTEEVNLTKSDVWDYHPRWSPDGKKIAFVTPRTGNVEIFVMEPDGSKQVNLTNHAGFDSNPAWSPDSKRIAFVSDRPGDGHGLFVMNADGTDQRLLLDRHFPRGGVFPSWSADGKQILLSGHDEGGSLQVFVANADGSGWEQLTQHAGVNGYAAWSPDSRYIAFAHFDAEGGGLPDPTGPGEVSPAGGNLMILDVAEGTTATFLKGELPWRAPFAAWRPMPTEPDAEMKPR
jgi:TolB protein